MKYEVGKKFTGANDTIYTIVAVRETATSEKVFTVDIINQKTQTAFLGVMSLSELKQRATTEIE